MSVSVADGLAAKVDLLWVAERWPDLRARLRPSGGASDGVRSAPSSRPPIDVHVSDLMFEIEEHARFLGQVLIEEADFEPTTSLMPALLVEVAERFGHFIIDDDKTALDFCDAAHEYRRKVTHTLTKPPAKEYLGDCPSGICTGDLRLRPGHLMAQCDKCDYETDVVTQREFIAGKLQERLMTQSELTSALVLIGTPVPYSTIRRWASGQKPRLREVVDGLYRLVDAMELAEARKVKVS